MALRLSFRVVRSRHSRRLESKHYVHRLADLLFELDIESALTTVWDHRPVLKDGRWIFTGSGKPTRRTWSAR